MHVTSQMFAAAPFAIDPAVSAPTVQGALFDEPLFSISNPLLQGRKPMVVGVSLASMKATA
jgi:hypothetical protein